MDSNRNIFSLVPVFLDSMASTQNRCLFNVEHEPITEFLEYHYTIAELDGGRTATGSNLLVVEQK